MDTAQRSLMHMRSRRQSCGCTVMSRREARRVQGRGDRVGPCLVGHGEASGLHCKDMGKSLKAFWEAPGLHCKDTGKSLKAFKQVSHSIWLTFLAHHFGDCLKIGSEGHKSRSHMC